MIELWLVRHGQTDWNAEGRYQGQTDIPLNEVGIAQARELAGLLRAEGKSFRAIYTSDLSRASQTADILGAAFNLSPIPNPGLREVDLGDWEGQNHNEVRERYPAEMTARRADPVDSHPPGGESVREVAQRVVEVANQIKRAHPRGRVLVVSHGIALATLICQANEIPLAEVFKQALENARPMVVHW